MALTATQKFLAGAICLFIGVLLLLLSAILDKTYWTFSLAAPVVFLAIPLIMIPTNLDGEGSFFESLGNFFVGLCLFSVPGLLFVLRHVKAITTQDTLLAIGGVVFLCAAIVFSSLAMRRSENYMASY